MLFSGRACAALMCLSAATLVPSVAGAVRVWEEPRTGWQPPAGSASTLIPGLPPSIAAMFIGSVASPDLRPPEFLQPLAAGGHVGMSRYPEGVAERWLDVGFFAQPRFTFQTGWSPDSASNFSNPPGISMRRTRLVLHGQAHPLLQVRMEFNVSDRIELLDTYALIPFHRAIQLQVGQFRVPFTRMEQVSSTRLQFTDSQLWSSGASQSGMPFIPSFDQGVMAWGWVGPRDLLEYYAGVFNGEGSNKPINFDQYFMYAARVVLNPLGRPKVFQESAINLSHDLKIQIGMNAVSQTRQIGQVAVDQGGVLTQVPNVLKSYYLGADLAVFGWGASVYSEVYFRSLNETDTVSAPSTEALGFLVQGGYFIPAPYVRDHLEIAARFQTFNPSDCFTRSVSRGVCGLRLPASAVQDQYRDLMHSSAITFGVNWYQLGHGFKIQAHYTLNYEWRDPAGAMPGEGIVNNDQFTLQITGSF